MKLAADFHHLGLAVRTLERAKPMLDALGYSMVGETVYDPLQNVNLTMYRHAEQPALELIERGLGDGPLERLLKSSEAIAYHLCYQVKDGAKFREDLDAQGVRLMTVSEPKPAVLFPDQAVSFHFVTGFGLIELLEPWPVLASVDNT